MRHQDRLRDPTQIVGLWEPAGAADPRLLEFRADDGWWATLVELDLTLLVTREYEHLVCALRAGRRGPEVSHLCLPHPSGLAVDRRRCAVHVACTRNPNLLMELRPTTGHEARADVRAFGLQRDRLVPVRARFLPGSLYLHDLAMIGSSLYGNAVGQNAVVRLDYERAPQRVWWPRCVEGMRLDRNVLQLNSIAAGRSVRDSFYTASCDRAGRISPGNPRFPVDRRGVLLSGRTREPVARGLTRPHSARLHRGQVWLDNSGYGEVGFVRDGRFEPVARPGGWTRGLCIRRGIAFVGTSRVLPRFRSYAPGLVPARCRAGVHAVDLATGRIRGSLVWPRGDQIFAIDWIPRRVSRGFPFPSDADRIRRTFYLFQTR